MSREQELQKQVNGLRNDYLELETRFKGVVDALYKAEILFGPYINYDFFYAGVNVLEMQKKFDERLRLILDHLGLEFEMVKCKDHYELREKKEIKGMT